VGAGESPMSDCRRRALLGFCKVRVSRHKAPGVTWRRRAHRLQGRVPGGLVRVECEGCEG